MVMVNDDCQPASVQNDQREACGSVCRGFLDWVNYSERLTLN